MTVRIQREMKRYLSVSGEAVPGFKKIKKIK
jgi:hypothetical protein